MGTTATTQKRRARGAPTWEIAELYPRQGQWYKHEYLSLPTNRLVEFSDGVIEVLPVPTPKHQEIVAFLYDELNPFVKARKLGKVLFAALPVLLWKDKFREPDLVFMTTEHASRMRRRYWRGADLVMEVVSDDPESQHRDLVEKRREYAKARIPEYWIVNPKKAIITVLRLKGRTYVVDSEYKPGDKAKSVLLPGFEVDVKAALNLK